VRLKDGEPAKVPEEFDSEQGEEEKTKAPQGTSLYLFKADTSFRRYLKLFVEHPYFENLIYHLIGLNSLLLMLDEPKLKDKYVKKSLDLMNQIVSISFIVEALLKIVNLGFCMGKNTYLKDNWNVLDFTIVMFTCLNWLLTSLSNIDVSFVRSFRALRALRPLRLVSKNEGMKTVVNSLLKSIPQLINVMLISLLFYMVFGILGVQIFRGSFGRCNIVALNKKDCTGTFTDPVTGFDTKLQWTVPFNNFDDCLMSMVTFFEISTLEMWPDIMWNAIDSRGHGLGPRKNSRVYMAAIFVIFIFITTFFVMNLFISVIVDRFNEEIRKKEG